METHETEPLPPWVERLKATTPEEIARAKEIERKARFALLVKYEPKEPEMKRNRPHGEDVLIGVTV